MSAPDAVMVNGHYVRTNLTQNDKELWRLAELQGRVQALADLRAKVEVMPSAGLGWVDRNDVLDLIDGTA